MVVVVEIDIVEAVEDVVGLVGLFDCSNSELPCIYYSSFQLEKKTTAYFALNINAIYLGDINSHSLFYIAS
jgi:hypothetical protein